MLSKCKQLLIELSNLKGSGRKAAFRRAEIVSALASDPEFLIVSHTKDEGEARESLAREVDDFGFSVDELIVMLKFAPDESTWTSTPLLVLRQEAFENKRNQQPRRGAVVIPLVERLRQRIGELETTVAELKHDNRTLRKKLKKIERSLAVV